MNLKEYLKSRITIEKQPDLVLIYQELLNLGYKSKEIYTEINNAIADNIAEAFKDYFKKKDENKN
jgi:hypothetical protein